MKDGLSSAEIRCNSGSFAVAYAVTGSIGNNFVGGASVVTGSVFASAGSFTGLVTAGSVTITGA